MQNVRDVMPSKPCKFGAVIFLCHCVIMIRVRAVRYSPITIMLLIITIIMIVPCMHEIHQNTIKYSSLCCSLHCLVDTQLAISMVQFQL